MATGSRPTFSSKGSTAEVGPGGAVGSFVGGLVLGGNRFSFAILMSLIGVGSGWCWTSKRLVTLVCGDPVGKAACLALRRVVTVGFAGPG